MSEVGRTPYLLEMQGITKRFPGVLAVDHVDLELERGKVLALVGENGAGKSTLMKILSGAYAADEGRICIDGEPVVMNAPMDAIRQGITVIYQELNTCETLSIAENIYVGNLPTKGRGPLKRTDKKEAVRRSREILAQLNLDYDPNTPVSKLSIAEKQIVEIAKALSRNTKVLVMDEPTAALNDKEVQMLFAITRRIQEMGTGVIFISHRLDEIFEICDHVMIMRDGRRVYYGATDEIDKPGIIRHMVGKDVSEERLKTDLGHEDVVLEVEHLSTGYVQDVSFFTRKGEIVGLFGLMGAGRTEIVKAIFGAVPRAAGTIRINGEAVQIHSPKDAKNAGIAYIPNDRKLEGLMLNQSIQQNICNTVLKEVTAAAGISRKKEEALAGHWISQLNVKTTDAYKDVNSLSGGNQQKVVMSKWLATEPKLMILNEPTRGVDVGAKREIYNIILDLCHKGMSVIMISSDLPEMLSMADRIVVIHEGKKVAEMVGDEITQSNLMMKAIGE